MSTKNNEPTVDVDWDEESGSWCVFYREKAVASFSDEREARKYLKETYS